MISESKFKSFKEFYPFYLSEHSKSLTKLLHAIGSIQPSSSSQSNMPLLFKSINTPSQSKQSEIGYSHEPSSNPPGKMEES